MSFNSPAAHVFLSVALVLLSVPARAGWRTRLLPLLNTVFLGLVLDWSARALLLLAAFLAFHLACVHLMLRTPRGTRRWLFVLWIVPTLLAFVVVKQYRWLTDPWLPHGLSWAPIETTGLSFVLFRQIGIAIEARDGTLESVPLLAYLNYTAAFWSFLAGPLQRFGPFLEQHRRLEQRQPASGDDVLDGLNRAAMGLLKVFVVGHTAAKYAVVSTFLDRPDLVHLAIFLLAYPLYLYVNFSGYCDVVIGFAKAIGLTLPENFNHPYVARDLNEFWSRWHITLSTFLRDYLYFPLQAVVARRAGAVWGMSVAAVVSFEVVGLWHGNTPRFAVFGLLHGGGIVVVNLYTQTLRRGLSRERWNAYRRSRIVQAAAIATCQAYVVITLLLFNYNGAELRAVLDAVRGLLR